MLMLIVSIVAAVMTIIDVSLAGLALVIVGASVVVECGGAFLYFKFGLLKFWYHNILGWHTPEDSSRYFGGLQEHAICKHCGKEIIQDSQGNWF